MMRKPLTPILSPGSAPETMLPPDNDREGRQPYAKELEDYKHGAVRPPEEQAGQEQIRSPTKEPNEK